MTILLILYGIQLAVGLGITVLLRKYSIHSLNTYRDEP